MRRPESPRPNYATSVPPLARSITAHRARILTAIEHQLSNGLIESVNTKIRLLTRIAFGFHGHEPLIALALLALGSHPPRLPGR